MKIEKFEDIIAWQLAGKLTVEIYNKFENIIDYRFKNQIQSASVSIMNNVAEGFERRTNKELRNFLFIAKGSCGEVRSMLYLAIKFNYLNIKDFNKIYRLTIEISRCLAGFIKTL